MPTKPPATGKEHVAEGSKAVEARRIWYLRILEMSQPDCQCSCGNRLPVAFTQEYRDVAASQHCSTVRLKSGGT